MKERLACEQQDSKFAATETEEETETERKQRQRGNGDHYLIKVWDFLLLT